MKHRCLIFGGRGFVGNAIGEQLSNLGYDIKLISRSDFDFIDKDARFKAQREIKDGDIVVLAAAIAPAKDIEMVFDNIRLTNNLVEATREKKISYLLNVSSDAVYGDLDEPLEESSLISPLNAHGVMHVMRERMIEQRVNSPIGHIRPTLIFGAGDPHRLWAK